MASDIKNIKPLIRKKDELPELDRLVIIIQEVQDTWDDKNILVPFVWVRRYSEHIDWDKHFVKDPLVVGWCYPEDLVDFSKRYLEFMDYVKEQEKNKQSLETK